MRIIAVSILLGAAIILGAWVSARPARCAWCPTFPCYNSSVCGQGCVCITPPGKTMGQCWGTN